ncbi:serine proteinase [Obba rivulosa]|uniref:Serine proteinase n=1 Tax=Obba rivulosa TaxID=1052685 RepID=A0A8E2AZB7_9APHY|nr:serine proteinase [Obba rivulosa]
MSNTGYFLEIEKCLGEKNESSYIVKLKPEVDKSVHLGQLRQRLGQNSSITHEYDSGFLNAYAGKFNEEILNHLRASTDVESISEDPIVRAFQQQYNAPWGLQRISQRAPLTNQNAFDVNFTYTYDASAGSGIDIYVLDTGVLTSHTEFFGRAKWGWTAPGLPSQDDNGHGTGVAAVALGTYYGVAKGANLIAVKVLDFAGTGSTSNIISGMEYVWNTARASGRPSIANMSLGGPGNTSEDSAVLSLAQAGIHVVAAAGNSNVDAGNISPARSDYCTTVGASTIQDRKWGDSNYGAVLDVFAPGENILTASKDSTTETQWANGTSFAAPHVSGIIACFISSLGNKSPADMTVFVRDVAVQNVLSGVPLGTPNLLENNGQ